MSAIRYTDQLKANEVVVENNVTIGGNIYYDDGELISLDTVGNITGNVDIINVGTIGSIDNANISGSDITIEHSEHTTNHTDSIDNISSNVALIGDVTTITSIDVQQANIAGNIGSINDMNGTIANLHGGVDSIANVTGVIETIDGPVNTIHNHGNINEISGSVTTVRDGTIDGISGNVTTISTNANIGEISGTITDVRGIDQLDNVSGTIDSISGTINSVGTIDSIMTVNSFPGSLTANTVDTISTLMSADIEHAETINSADTINTLSNVTTAESITTITHADHIETVTTVEGNVDAGTVNTLHTMSNGSIDHAESVGNVTQANTITTITTVEGTVEANTVNTLHTMSGGNIDSVESVVDVSHADHIETVTTVEGNVDAGTVNTLNTMNNGSIDNVESMGHIAHADHVETITTVEGTVEANTVGTVTTMSSGNVGHVEAVGTVTHADHIESITDANIENYSGNINAESGVYINQPMEPGYPLAVTGDALITGNLDVTGSGTFNTRVAIGTNVAPSSDVPLHVVTEDGSHPLITFENTHASATAASIGLRLQNTEQTFDIGAFKLTGLQFRGGGATRMTMLTNGNLGIGTVDPTARLDVNGPSRLRGAVTTDTHLTVNGRITSYAGPSIEPMALFQADSSDARRVLVENVGGGAAMVRLRSSNPIGGVDGDWGLSTRTGHDGAYSFYNYDTGQYRMAISKDGNVRIDSNITDPMSKLYVDGEFVSTGNINVRTTSTGWNGLNLSTTSGSTNWAVRTSSAGRLAVADIKNNRTVMTYNENGDVGIGTTTPTRRLHVDGGIMATGYIETSADIEAGGNITAWRDLAIYGSLRGLTGVHIDGDVNIDGMTTVARYTPTSIDVSQLPVGMTQSWYVTPEFSTVNTLTPAMTFNNMNVAGVAMVIQLDITFVQVNSNNMVGWANVHIRKLGTGQPGIISEGKFYTRPGNPGSGFGDVYQLLPSASIAAGAVGNNVVLSINLQDPSGNQTSVTAVGFVKASIMKIS